MVAEPDRHSPERCARSARQACRRRWRRRRPSAPCIKRPARSRSTWNRTSWRSAAQKHAIPLAAIRVIIDPAGRALPDSALAGMRPDGSIDSVAMMHHAVQATRAICRQSCARRSMPRAARATLVRGRQLLGPGLGCCRDCPSDLRSCMSRADESRCERPARRLSTMTALLGRCPSGRRWCSSRRGLVGAPSAASAARISDSVCCTWSREHVLRRPLAARARFPAPSAPSVRTPRSATRSALSGLLQRRVGGGRLVAAMRHAVRALLVARRCRRSPSRWFPSAP